MNWVAVATGGAIGSVLRYWVSVAINSRLTTSFPWGTLTVNITGSFLIGLAYILIQQRFSENEFIRLFVIVGVLGGFTTFSTFSIETVHLIQSDDVIRAAGNIIFSFLTCIVSVLVGIEIGRSLTAS